MAIKNGMTKGEYARRYDEYASRLYYFALRLTGDELLSRRAMAELFTEGYRRCREETFLEDMVATLWEILESDEPKAKGSALTLPTLRDIPLLSRAAVLMKIVFPIKENAVAEILDVSQPELDELYSAARAGAAV